MKYCDYKRLKLSNSSKDELTNFSINFAQNDQKPKYLPRLTVNNGRDEQINPNRNNNRKPTKSNQENKIQETQRTQEVKDTQKSPKISTNPKPTDTNKTTVNETKKPVLGSDNQSSSSSKPNSEVKTTTNEQTKKSPNKESKQAETSPSTKVATESKQTTESNKSESTTQNKENSVEESRTVKNYYGKDVEFEKRNGKWYRKGTNEEVTKDGKWKSYFDEKNGVKDVQKGTKSNTSVAKSKKTSGKVTVGKVKIDNGTRDKYVDPLGHTLELTKSQADDYNSRGQKLTLARDLYKNSQKARDFKNLELNHNIGKISDSEYSKRYKDLVSKYGEPSKEFA